MRQTNGLWVKLGLLTAACFGAWSCQRLQHESTYTLEPGDIRYLTIDAPRGDQKVVVDVTVADALIDVCLVTADRQEETEKRLTAEQKLDPSHVLAMRERMGTGTLEATVPAGNAFAIFLSGASKKTEVKVKVSGR